MANNFRFEYIGNLHIHSSHSDGGKGTGAIAREAKKAGLDFIAINDHSHMTELHREDEGYKKGMLVLVGSEIGGRYHHYLAYNLKTQVTDENLSPQKVIDEVNEQGGFGFIAHPFEKGMPFLEHGIAYTWNDWGVRGFTGICIWNFSSRWKENVTSFWHGIFNLMFKKYTLKGPSRETLAMWDRLCKKRRVVAIGGSDAHGSLMKFGFLKFTPLSYRYLLGTINTHVLVTVPLSGDFAADSEAVYRSLRNGNCFIAHDDLCSAEGFRFSFVRDKQDGRIEMGQEAEFNTGKLIVRLPRKGKIRVIRDGFLFKEMCDDEGVVTVEQSGVYRVEAFYKVFPWGWRPWIFSNPIYLK